ncbi:hypothetical protein GCM10007967_19020 [Xylanimonas ulmi]|uniref:O-antigen ligase-like membrane protein n=2 Tax=Xylanimonas ulmi TaxID=228973 RepID=A0A4Q7M200_9MICO|nr:O-antigen ligase-like membrane protein [Xylanibacterium ulmi]
MAIVLLGAAPLAFLPGGLYRFALPKLAVLAVGALVAAYAAPRGRLPRSVVTGAAVGCVLFVTAALAGAAPLAQLVGRWPRYEGVLGLVVYLSAVWAGARVLGPQSRPQDFGVAVRVAAGVAVILAAISVAELCGLRPLGGDVARPGALLGNATDQGIVGACLAANLVGPALRRQARLGRAVATLGLAAALVTVVASGSRAALLGGLIGLGVVGLAQPRAHRRRTLAGTCASAAALVALALVVPGTRSRVTGESPLAVTTITSRLEQWSATVSLVRDHLWLGVGPSGFVEAFPAYRPLSWTVTQNPAGVLDSPHNWVLQVLAAGGVALALCSVVLAAVVASAARASIVEAADGARREYLVGGAAGAVVVAVAGLTHFTSPGIVAVVAAPLGTLVAARHVRAPNPRPVIVFVRGGMALLVAVLGVACAAEIPLARGAAAAARGDVANAEHDFAVAEHLRPWDADVPLIAAQSFVPETAAGDKSAAQAAGRWSARALDRLPGSIEAGSIHVLALLGVGKPEAAADEASVLVVVSTTDPYLRLLYGLALARSGEPTRAIEELRLASQNPYLRELAQRALGVVMGSGK